MRTTVGVLAGGLLGVALTILMLGREAWLNQGRTSIDDFEVAKREATEARKGAYRALESLEVSAVELAHKEEEARTAATKIAEDRRAFEAAAKYAKAARLDDEAKEQSNSGDERETKHWILVPSDLVPLH